MANIVATNAYWLNSHAMPTGATAVGLPTQGCVLTDCSNSPTRNAPGGGINVYSCAQTPSGDKYYFVQTFAQLVTLFNA